MDNENEVNEVECYCCKKMVSPAANDLYGGLCEACWDSGHVACHLCGTEYAREDMYWYLGGDGDEYYKFGFCWDCENITCDIELPIDEKTKKLILTFQ